MANLWKLGREARRLRQQAAALAEAFTEPRRQARYDADRLSHLQVTEGAVALSDRVALLMIYQPVGVAASIPGTCRHLVRCGFAPFVISNGELSKADREGLARVAWRVASRPNYGYDFGAYRDGVLALKDWGIAPDTLLILNDSVWLPLGEEDDLVPRLEALDADIAGSILRRRRKSGLGGDPREIRFLESYCYLVGKRALAHPAFDAYWRGYRMTDNKYKVIRRGERDFSLAMQAAGLRLVPLLTEAAFVSVVEALDVADLRRTVLYGAHADEVVAHEQQAVLARYADTPAWRAEALSHVARALRRGVFNSAFCYPTIGQLRGTYVKKSGERINRLWRARYLAAVRAGDLPAPDPVVMAEISASVARDGP